MTVPQQNNETAQRLSGGVVLALSTALTIAALFNHPGGGGSDLVGTLQAAVAERRTDQFVHGAVIAALIGSAFGGTVLARHLGMSKAASLAGLVAYLFGCVVTVLAALIDGFVTPDVAVQFLEHSAEDPNFGLAAVLMIGALIEDLTRLGIVLISAAILCWSSILLRRRGWPALTGAIGVIAGLLPFVLFAHHSRLNPHLLIGIFATQCLWNLAIARILISAKPQ